MGIQPSPRRANGHSASSFPQPVGASKTDERSHAVSDDVPETAHAVPVGLPTAFVLVHGELDMATAVQLHTSLNRVARGRRRIVIDVQAVSFVDVAGLRGLSSACRSMIAAGIEVVVIPSECLRRLLKLTQSLDLHVDLPVGHSLALVCPAELAGVTLTASRPQTLLRPVETRVLRLLDAGYSTTEVAFRFQRSARWVEQVAAFARERLKRCTIDAQIVEGDRRTL